MATTRLATSFWQPSCASANVPPWHNVQKMPATELSKAKGEVSKNLSAGSV
jgi:hypothetical protein